MRDSLLAVAVFAAIAITSAVDEECIQRKIRGLPVHWPNPTDCASFYRCTNKNIKRELVCPEGKIYNTKTGRCANQGRSPCQLSLAAPLSKSINNTCADKLSGTFVPDPSSCRGFGICNNNLSYPQTCKLGSYFNTSISACEPDTKTDCWENLCVNETHGKYIPDRKDCHSFYVCYDKTPVAQNCLKGSYFNVDRRSCQPGRCPSEEVTTTTTDATTTPETSTSTETSTRTSETTTTCVPETTSTCAPDTTTSSCTDTTTTTCAVTTTTSCTDKTTTTSCAPEITTTSCAPETTSSSSTTESTTTSCAPDTTTTSCFPKTTTTTCSPPETTTPAKDDCSNLKCDSAKCQHGKGNFVFPAQHTNSGFCTCLNKKSEYRECPDNGVFNESLLICVPQEKVCPSSKCLKEPENITFPAANTTTGFCRCLHGQASFFECLGSGYVYNHTLGICVKSTDYEEQPNPAGKSCKGGYREGDFVRKPDNCMLFYICYEGELEEVSCEMGNYFNDSIKACLPDAENKCPDCHQADAFFNSRRHKRSIRAATCVEGSKTTATDCDKYYKCSGGHRLLYGCEKDYFFNITTLDCQLDVQHVCCPVNSCEEGEKNAYPEDDTKYYECVQGKMEVRSCGQDSYFNKLKKACVAKKECTCPGNYKEGDISPHPTDCDKFYICRNSEQVLRECFKENFFNKSSLTCERDITNKCWSKADCTCPGGYQEGDFSIHPKDCSKFYICHDGQQLLKDCGPNNHFNKTTLACERDVHHVCWPNLCEGKPNGALIENPQQCNAFFLCSNNEATAKSCSEGQWFDPNITACVADTKAICYNPCANENGGPIVLIPHPVCNNYFFCNDKKTFVGTCMVGSFDIETGVCNEAKKCFPNPCDNPETIVFPDAYDPSKFYWCNSEKQPIPYTCPAGMQFDLEYKICKKVSDPDCLKCREDGAFSTLNNTNDSEFCVCVDGVSTKIECPNEYSFNPELGVCYSNAPCDPSYCLHAPEYATALNRNCSKSFCMCFNKKPTIINCPNNGNFNPYTLECSDYEISPECLQSTCIGETSNTRVFNPINTKTSNGFCQCINQIATFKPCNSGSTLNPELLICQLAEINCNSSQCCGLADKTIIPAVATTAGYCECLAGTASYHECPDNGEFNVTSNKCEASLCDLTKCAASRSNYPYAASVPNGFCMCNVGFVACQPEGTLFSEEFRNCMDPCPQVLCNDKPDKYLVSSVINKNSFCVCHSMSATYEVCPSESFVFDEAQQMCVGNSEELCGTELCKNPGSFEAKGTLNGFCLCTDSGKKPTFQKCLEGVYVAAKEACLPRAKDVCNLAFCVNATVEHPITMPANNSILEFCYCSSSTNAMLLLCPNGKYYNPDKGMCTSELEENCSCPNNIAAGDKVADSTACNKYSQCVNGVMESRTCPAGEYFSVTANCCILDTDGACNNHSQCTCLGIYYENERLSHPVNPQMYYVCQDNSLHEYKCQTGHIFSATQKQCIAKTNLRQKRSVELSSDDHEFGCLENEKRSVPSNCSQYEICEQQRWNRKTCSNYRYYNPEQRKCLVPRDDYVCSYAKVTTLPICNASLEYYLSKAKNCQHYYRCEAGKWRLNSCGQKQYFNTKLSSCLALPDDTAFKCELLQEQLEEKQTIKCQHLSQRFYGQNCAMYLMCLDNEWWYQYCPNDMYYNRTLNYCVRDTHQQCKDVVQSKANFDNEEFAEDFCQQDGFLRPSAMACNRYFVCVNGKWQMQHCSRGEYYDVTYAKCSADTEGVCGQLNKDCLPNERKSLPRNCSSYEECSSEGKWLEKSCTHGEIFDDLLQQCTVNMGVCSKHGLKRTCRPNETISVKQNCSLFYYCSQDTWSLGSCLKGFMYSAEKQMCVAHMPHNSCNPVNHKQMQLTENSFSAKNNPCERKMDGYAVAHPNDCSRYYICIQSNTSHEMQCPRGSYFDSGLGYCRPNDGSCRLPLTGACSNASDASLVPHPSDCQAFYSCSSINGTELLHCSKDQYFDPHTRQCRIDHGECIQDILPKRKCAGLRHGTHLAHESYCNIYYVCIKGLAIPVECPDSQQFSSILSKCVADKEHQCQTGRLVESNITYSCGNLSDGIYFADLKDCTRYYICSQGQALPKKCAHSSYFDSEQLLCVPDDGFCPFVNKNEGQNKPAPPDPSTCEGKHGYLMSDPSNCNNFYVCIHNKLKHERCYSQQFFNATSQQCQQRFLQETDLNGNGTLDDSEIVKARKIKTPQCQDKATSLKELCTRMSEGSSFAEAGDCRRYITCQDSEEEPISQRCRNGESFDSLLGFCRQNDGTCLLENGQRVGECSGKHGQLARDPHNCRNYFVCINGQKIFRFCAEDEYFSKTQNMCTKDKQQVCQPNQAPEGHATQSCAGLSESVLYPYIHDNCRSYFQCINGVPKIHMCADDLYFDPLTIKCIKNKTECVMPTPNQQRSPEFSQTFNKLCSNKKLEYPYANVDNECRSFYLCHANGDVSHELCPLGMMFSKEHIMCIAGNKTSCT